MTTKAHKLLTGTDLHEPKGVENASENDVYFADGSGSGAWAGIDANNVSIGLSAFSAKLLHLQDQKNAGSNGGTFNANTWVTRTLNTTITNEITGASISNNQITLPAGTFFILGSAPASRVNHHRARLFNVTDSSVILNGTCEASPASVNNSIVTRSMLSGRFTLSASKVVSIQHQCKNTETGDGLGVAFGIGTEVYTDIMIWQLA